MLLDLVCPISGVRTDRNVVRTNGILTTMVLVAYAIAPWKPIIIAIALDYLVRAALTTPSPMTYVARGVARGLSFPPRAMDIAPKIFASRIGVCFAIAAAVTAFVAPAASPWLAGILAACTLLEGAFDLCIGCVIYTYVALPLRR